MEKNGIKYLGNRPISRRDMLKLIGATVGAAALAGCAQKATEVAGTGVPVEVPVTEVPVTEVPMEEGAKAVLRFQNHWSKDTDAHVKGMDWLYKEFHAKYPDITIENILNPDSQESYKKITADCAAGDCPDIIHGPGPEMWEAGYLLDLTPYIEEDAAWKDVLISDTLYRSGDKIWGLDGEYSPMSTIWNTRILEKAGVSDIPTTWDEFMDVCDKIKQSGKVCTSWGVGGSHQWHNIIASQEGGLEALGKNEFDAPQIKEAFNLMKTFVDNKWVPDNEIELTWQQSVALFVAEETAFFLNGAWTLNNEIRGEGAAADLRENVKFTPYPGAGPRGTTVEMKKTTSIGISAAVANDKAKLDAAIKFLKFWFSEEGAKQWILLTQSPMGVKVNLTKIEGVDPLLLSFLGAKDQANVAYSLPDTKAMQQRGWDDCWSGLTTLLAGKSVDEAVAAFVTEMSQYK